MRTVGEYARLPTEKVGADLRDWDRWPLARQIDRMNREDARAVAAVGRQRRSIARAVELIVERFRRGGNLIFIGAGTSGRLGVLEAAECPPTFCTLPHEIQAVMAGGAASVFRSREGAEDVAAEARRALRSLRPQDVLVGVAASGVTPFVEAGLRTARRRKAAGILVTCHPRSPLMPLADVAIAVDVGPEVIAGSTRLKAGSATKMILNMLTTLSMVRLGKTLGPWMVDLKPTSRKLKARGIRLVSLLAGVSLEEATRLFRAAGGRVKTAVVMKIKNLDRADAEKRLGRVGGYLRDALL